MQTDCSVVCLYLRIDWPWYSMWHNISCLQYVYYLFWNITKGHNSDKMVTKHRWKYKGYAIGLLPVKLGHTDCMLIFKRPILYLRSWNNFLKVNLHKYREINNLWHKYGHVNNLWHTNGHVYRQQDLLAFLRFSCPNNFPIAAIGHPDTL